MLTNTDITIFSRGHDPSSRLEQWEKVYVQEAWWFKQEQSSITADGRKNTDVYTIRIPNISVQIKKDDYIVKGMSDIQMQTVKDLGGIEKTRVTSVNYNNFGDNPHIKVVGV